MLKYTISNKPFVAGNEKPKETAADDDTIDKLEQTNKLEETNKIKTKSTNKSKKVSNKQLSKGGLIKKRKKNESVSSSDDDEDEEEDEDENHSDNEPNGHIKKYKKISSSTLLRSMMKNGDNEEDENDDDILNDTESDDDEETGITGRDRIEKQLENVVFGADNYIIRNMNKNKKKSSGLNKNITNNFAERLEEHLSDRKPAWQDNDDQQMVDLNKFKQFSSMIDPDKKEVSTVEIEESLKARFSKYFGNPVWADLDSNKKKKRKNKKGKKLNADSQDERSQGESEMDESDLEDEHDSDFKNTGNYLSSSKRISGVLPAKILDIKTCTDANKEEPHDARLKCAEFHPTARVMLTGGYNQKLTLFQIDGKKNPKIQSIFIDKFPILAAHFTRNGEEIIMGSKHKSFYYYDMISGKIVNVTPPVKALDEYQRSSMCTNFEISPDNRLIAFIGSYGQIHLFSVKSKEWINTLKINENCNTVTFSSDSRYLFAFGDDKDVNIFDMNDRGNRCIHKFNDHGCLSGTSIAVSNNSQFIATGCKSGVVNLYDLNGTILMNTQNRNPKPLKSFMNLTTPCTHLKFNSTSEILAACSSFTENACKLIHVGSMSVFSNFPIIQTGASSASASSIRIPQAIDFSMNSGYLTIGNHKGNALLYRLKHYGSY